MMNDRPSPHCDAGTAIAPKRPAPVTETVARPRFAPLYRVLIHNDDVTPMEFVVGVLRRFFHVAREKANLMMLEAHLSGVALVVVLSLEEAEFRVEQAHSFARGRKYPLTFSIEPEG